MDFLSIGMIKVNKEFLENIYKTYNRREYVDPDPLVFLYQYEDPGDREIVALIASSLAYGKVSQILKSVQTVLDIMGHNPLRYLTDARKDKIDGSLSSFKHRFTGPEEISSLLRGMKKVIRDHGSLYSCFRSFFKSNDNIINALAGFVNELKKSCSTNPASLIPDPLKGSACKRLNLFLRWMVRNDDVDPGGWSAIPLSALIVPLDTHMHRFSLEAGLTERKGNNIRTALEITGEFKKICCEDPVKYDFAITRYGIRDDISWEEMKIELSK